ncbi:MAG: dUTP diphosphatase [Parcubacteria group bacterium]|nr:dUTP diphosphatase [Parcubacteria group bacterium]
MQVKIKRIDKTLPLPSYQTEGAVAFDLHAREDAIINPKEIKIIPANLIVETPPGYFLLLACRSSLPYKKGLMLANGIGIVDQDYCGPNDELGLQLFNPQEISVEIKRGDRIGQAMFIRFERGHVEEVEELAEKSRSGFGSTGGYQ